MAHLVLLCVFAHSILFSVMSKVNPSYYETINTFYLNEGAYHLISTYVSFRAPQSWPVTLWLVNASLPHSN